MSSGASPFVPLKPIDLTHEHWYDSCTFIKQKDIKNQYGCYTFRSCQSCLETESCMINDLGICVNQYMGMKNLNADYQHSTSYTPAMNYLHAIQQNLSLPQATTANKEVVGTEQNWHFRAGEATYCKANDAVCRECKANNFWRGNDADQLSDSRFCVGENGCVCIQTCEVPSFKSPGCQWKLSQPSSYSGGYYGTDTRYVTEVTHLAYWEWLLIVLAIIVINLLFLCCSRSKSAQLTAAREEAVRAVRRELGIPEDEPVAALVRNIPVVRRQETELTAESSVHDDEDIEEVKSPYHQDSFNDPESAFVEIQDIRPSPSHAQSVQRTEV